MLDVWLYQTVRSNHVHGMAFDLLVGTDEVPPVNFIPSDHRGWLLAEGRQKSHEDSNIQERNRSQ